MTNNGMQEFINNSNTFTSGNQLLKHGYKISVVNKIRQQPGYRRGEKMRIAVAKTGGKRLYVLVSGQWMDGSLADIKF